MKKYKYILLDWDGCMAKTLDIILDAYKKTFAEYGIFPDDQTVTHEIFGGWHTPEKLGITDLDGFNKKYIARVEEKYFDAKLYDGVLDTLVKLREAGKKLAVITTAPREIVEPVLIHNKLKDLLNTVLTADDVAHNKPDPEIVYDAIKNLGGNKTEAIIMGDSKSDLGAGQNSGIDSILFYPQENRKFYELEMLEEYKPTYIIDEFSKILEIVT